MLTAFGRTDIGRVRSSNQDSIFLSTDPIGPLPNLFIVADGMGGHNGGGIASESAISHFCKYIKKSGKENSLDMDGFLDLMTAAAASANDGVLAQAELYTDLKGMGTTLTACTMADDKCIIIHAGDSRAYALSTDSIVQLTQDHSYVGEMVKAGQLSKDEARKHPRRNELTRVVGFGPKMDGLIHQMKSDQARVVLLCSDGLYNMLSENDILEIVCKSENIETATNTLIITANAAGGTDNISVVLIEKDGNGVKS